MGKFSDLEFDDPTAYKLVSLAVNIKFMQDRKSDLLDSSRSFGERAQRLLHMKDTYGEELAGNPSAIEALKKRGLQALMAEEASLQDHPQRSRSGPG